MSKNSAAIQRMLTQSDNVPSEQDRNVPLSFGNQMDNEVAEGGRGIEVEQERTATD